MWIAQEEMYNNTSQWYPSNSYSTTPTTHMLQTGFDFGIDGTKQTIPNALAYKRTTVVLTNIQIPKTTFARPPVPNLLYPTPDALQVFATLIVVSAVDYSNKGFNLLWTFIEPVTPPKFHFVCNIIRSNLDLYYDLMQLIDLNQSGNATQFVPSGQNWYRTSNSGGPGFQLTLNTSLMMVPGAFTEIPIQYNAVLSTDSPYYYDYTACINKVWTPNATAQTLFEPLHALILGNATTSVANKCMTGTGYTFSNILVTSTNGTFSRNLTISDWAGTKLFPGTNAFATATDCKYDAAIWYYPPLLSRFRELLDGTWGFCSLHLAERPRHFPV